MVTFNQSPLIQEEEGGIRLDRWFKRHYPQLSHTQLEKMLRTGQVRLEGRRVKSSERLVAGQVLRLPPLPVLQETFKLAHSSVATPTRKLPSLNLEVLYEDEEIIVINKPSGLATQGGTKISFSLEDFTSSLASPGQGRPKLVHRLDKETSGVILLARTSKAATFLANAFKTRQVEKKYWAAVCGKVKQSTGLIKAPLTKKSIGGQEKVIITQDGEYAESTFTVIDRAGSLITWLELMPKTGRTHQLRVHCAYLGHPILGDGKYGAHQAFPLGRPCILHLHAWKLTIPKLQGRGFLTFTAPLPPHMQQTWQKLGWQEG